MRKYFNTIGNKYYWCGNEHGGYGFGEWKFFSWSSMPMHVHLRVLRIYFLRYQENSHPENFHQSNSPLVNPLWKILTWNIPTHAFKYSRRVFLISLLLPLSLILLKRLPCNSMFQKCWSLFVCEKLPKQSLKWRKAINEMGGNNPGENFLGANFLEVGVFQGGVWWVGIFRVGISPGEGIFIEPFSSYNVSILIFQKIINKYYKTFDKKICTFNS